jgi:type III pantothenate kinase
MVMSCVLVLDLGNSRTKWGLHSGRGWISFGVTPNTEIGTLALREWQNLPRPIRVVGVNVAGEPARMRIEAQLARWRVPPKWLTASAAAGGVVNRYAQPGQLGADRWAALVAARKRALAMEPLPPPVVVVNAGTAVTVDALDADGVFRGGVILPGLRLMLQALAEHTAGLKFAPGKYQDFPTNSSDALYSGAVQAIAGAIGEMRARLAGDAGPAKCLLAGGAATEIAPHLGDGVEVVDSLVLEGVLALADAG